MGFLIDSSVIVASERGRLAIADLQERIAQEEVAFSAITASELLHGVHQTHAAIWADLARAGTPVGAHDLQIAATALTHGLTVATRNVRDFERVEGLAVVVW